MQYTLEKVRPGLWHCYVKADKVKVVGAGKDANRAIRDYKEQLRRWNNCEGVVRIGTTLRQWMGQ